MPSGFFSAVFHYPQQRAFVYDRRTLKLLRADVKFPALTKSDYIRVIEGRIHLLAAAMVEEGREESDDALAMGCLGNSSTTYRVTMVV